MRNAKYWALFLLALLVFAGCRAPKPASDARAVEALVPALRDADEVLSEPADPGVSEEARRRLRAPLTAEAVVEVALASNREIRAALHEIGMARGDWLQSRLLPNPVAEVELLPERESQLELRLEYDLTEALLAPARAKTTAPRVEGARLRAAEVVINESAAARTAFIRLQAATARLKLGQDILETFSAEREAVLALASSGNIPEFRLAEQVTAEARAQAMVAERELTLLESREALITLLGLSGADTSFEIDPALAKIPTELQLPEVEQISLRKNFSLLAARKSLEAVSAETGYLRTKGSSPDVSFDIHLLWQNPSEVPPGSVGDEWRVGGGVSSTVPIFDREQGRLKRAESAFDAQMERYVGAAASLRSAVRRTAGRLLSTHARALHLRGTVLPAQQKLSEQLLLQYNAMQADVFALLRAKRAELELEHLALSAEEEFLVAQVELDAYLLGGTPKSSRTASDPSTLSLIGASASGH